MAIPIGTLDVARVLPATMDQAKKEPSYHLGPLRTLEAPCCV